ncbi:hypothetical protein IQ457_07195 [Psychrobacter sp. M9-54-1]|uniref:hypothetical protein n=1 Tax=Psychrobacter sp. M9-54-1 TaxID=2782386 RepID=UPI00190C5F60|nr:hypothetical protein [Psychrobacter sp. M9-54-1]MBK3393725.1 hypothetical protein [Psychrobacter sp. M9-54-1]
MKSARKVAKGDTWQLKETGAKVVITHSGSLSVGWRESGAINTTHTSRKQFLIDYSKPRALIASDYIERTFLEIGGIGSFNKIFTAVLAGKKRVRAEVLRSALHSLCDVGTVHYFERSDTYMFTGVDEYGY